MRVLAFEVFCVMVVGPWGSTQHQQYCIWCTFGHLLQVVCPVRPFSAIPCPYIFVRDWTVCCPSQCLVTRPFALSAEDEYQGGYHVWSLRPFLVENNMGGIIVSHVLWLPSASKRIDFFLFPGCAIRRGCSRVI